MRNWVVLLAAASLGLNIFLLCSVRQGQTGGNTAYSSVVIDRPLETDPPVGHSAQRAPAASRDVTETSCETRILECQSRLSETRTALEKHLPLDQRFKNGEPNPEAAARLSQYVADAFGPDPPDYTFECRNTACLLQVQWPTDRGDDRVMQYFQDQKSQELFDGAMFTGTTPGADPLAKKTYHRQAMYFGLPSDDTASGMALLQKVVADFRAASISKQCFDRHATDGQLSVALAIGEETDHRISVEHGGSLAGTPSETCLLAGLQNVIAQTTIPAKIRGAVLHLSISQPPTAPN